MRLTRMQIAGFGRLSNSEFTFAPGLSLIVGDNESGKSTLQRAILVGLFGFYEREHAAKGENPERLRFSPWKGGAYACTVDFELGPGQHYRCQRSFETQDSPTQISDLVSGADVSSAWELGRHGVIASSSQRSHFGADRQAFTKTAFITQGQLGAIEQPGGLSEALLAAVDNLGSDVSARRAVGGLDAALRELGTEAASKKALGAASKRLEAYKQELDILHTAQEATSQAAAVRESASEQAAALRLETCRLRLMVLDKRIQEIEQRLHRLSDCERRRTGATSQASSLRQWATFPVEQRDQVLAAKRDLDSLTAEVTALQAQWAGCQPRLQELRSQASHLKERLLALEYARDFDTTHAATIRDQAAVLQRQRQQVLAIQERQSSTPPVVAPKRAAPSLAVLAGGIGLAVLALAGFVLIRAPALGVAAAAVILAGTLALAYLLRKPGGSAQPDSAADPAKAARLELAELEQRLVQALSSAGISAASLDEALAAHNRRAQDHAELAAKEQELALALANQKPLLAVQESLDLRQAQQTSAARLLRELLSPLGIESSDAVAAVAEFEHSCERRRQHDRCQTAAKAAADERAAVLAGQAEGELGQGLTRLREQRDALLAAAPELSGLAPADESLASLEGSLLAAEARLREAESRRDSLATEIATRMESFRCSRSDEVEEDLARAQAELERLRHYSQALQIAKQVIEQAAEETHRNFAPRLNDEISKAMSQVSAERYRNLYVDPGTFAVRAESDEAARLVDVSELSQGTREQAYVLLRLAITRLLSQGGQPLPLILDDPFVNSDQARLERMLSFLAGLSGQNQVLLFTKDPAIESWFEANLAGQNEHSLIRLLSP